MLEYNADTPSLQIESGVLTQEWRKNFKSYSNDYYTVNYLDDAMRQFAPKMKKQCSDYDNLILTKSIGLLANPVDEENMAVMQHYMSIFGSMFAGEAEYINVADLEFKYNYITTNSMIQGKKTVVINNWHNHQTRQTIECLLGIYPKEWMISEQQDYAMK